MAHTDPLELAIRKELGRVYLCTLDELSALLDRFPAAQVAATVERLTGEGAIACRNSDASRCILWLPPTRAGRRGFEESPAAKRPIRALQRRTWLQTHGRHPLLRRGSCEGNEDSGYRANVRMEIVMATKMQQAGQLWSIVLATGESAGVDPFVCRWLGRPLPKEYCAFVGGRSMFQHALDRAVQITPPERLIAVVAKEHRQEAFEQLDRRTIGALLLHSIRQGTVASLFLSLTYVQERDPDATVVVFPSDHFVYPEERYLGQVKRALSLAESHPDRLLMLGSPPDRLELEYGWIQPGPRLSETPDEDLKSVQSIVEQPSAVQADSLLQAGGLWNTKAFVGKVRTLWNLGWTAFLTTCPSSNGSARPSVARTKRWNVTRSSVKYRH